MTVITATLNRPSLDDACASINAQSHSDWHHYVLGDGILPRDVADPRRTTMGFSRCIGAEEPGINMPEGTPNPILRWALQHLDLGDFVCFLDDDNTYSPAFMERMLTALITNPATGIALCALRDHRYQRVIPGFPDGRCDNSGFLVRSEVAKRIPFPEARPEREVLQDCEFIATCASQTGWTRVPEVLVDFGISDNTPPGRGKVKWLESWAEPIRAARRTRDGDAAGAIDLLADAAEQDQLDAWTLWHLGEALLVTGARREALLRWAAWLDLFEDHGIEHDWIRYCAGLAHAAESRTDQSRRHVAIAMDLLQRRIAANPTNMDNRLNEGLYGLLLGTTDAALDIYRRLSRQLIGPDDLEEARWKLQILRRTVPDLDGVDEALHHLTEPGET